MIDKLYSWLHRNTGPRDERDEYSSGPWQVAVRAEALRLCRPLSEGRIIEIGCGEGLFLTKFAAENPSVECWGIDNDGGRLFAARERARSRGITNLHFALQDATCPEFADNYFDRVVCINVLFNLPSMDDVATVLAQMRRIAKDNCRVIFDFRNGANPLLKVKYSLAHYYDRTVKDLPLMTYTPAQIAELIASAGLTVATMNYIGFPIKALAPLIVIEAKKR